MKMETLLIGNKLLEQMKWCDKVIEHIDRKDMLVLGFKITMENKEYFNCPDWLMDIIRDNIVKYRANVEERFKNLKDIGSVEDTKDKENK